jgi:hypothetical protein
VPILYAAPIILILAGRMRGCRPEERRLIAGIGAVCAVGCAAALVASRLTASLLIEGVAYACLVMSATHLAMLLGQREDRGGEGPGGSDGDGGAPQPPDGEWPPFDWDDFERRFWDEVAKRRDRTPA